MGAPHRGRALGTAAIAMVLALSACAAPGTDAELPVEAGPAATAAADRVQLETIEPLADAAGFVGPSTAALASDHIIPVSKPTSKLPTVVTSHSPTGDEQIEITEASRVVAMDTSGSIAGTVWGLGFGETLVGVDIAAQFEGTEDLTVVTGSSHSVNLEAILALKPDVVITDGSIGPRRAVAQLADAGVDVVFVENQASFEGAAQLARDVAAIFGAADAGETLAESILSEVEQTKAEVARLVPDEPLRMAFLYLRGSAGVYYLFGSDSGADDLFEALGGIDAGAEAGIAGEQPMTDEAMLAMDPDVIYVMTSGLESVGGIDGLLEAKPAIALTAAGQQRRFVDMDASQVLSFGPRSAQVLEALAIATYAPTAAQ